ncbi:uncharacterized protein LOC141724723 isoform X2 [Apium graveolens]|uniref:uncharacterized protein LOC141724723 isoform X2 n=1 Tax=Apium graveolens TaxID=4045 RepID=UPI003D7B2FE1
MFEAHVLHLLRRYLGEYVHGLSAEALRISVWKGDVVLKDLKLKAEALNSLQLPVTVKAGFIGTITLKVPWKSLGKEPVIVLIDRVFVLAHPAPDARSIKEEDREKRFEAKLQQIESPSGNSWLGSLISTIIGNLKITISNVHVRYEDSTSNPGNSFACGVTLAKLAAVTMDEQGNETFDTSGALDKLRKSVQLERLAMYHDSNQLPWSLDKIWEDLTPKEWIEIFEDGINESGEDGGTVSRWAQDRKYLVSPINGDLKYHRLGNEERSGLDEPSEKVSLILSDVSLTIAEAQYHDWIRLFENFSRYKAYLEVYHIRPVVPVLENPKSWWRYAAQASLQQKRICYRFSWDQVQSLCHLRRRYIQLYASSLQKLSNFDNKQIRDIEKDLDPKVILLWRFLAHAKAESVRSKEEAERRMLKTKSWFSFTWGTPSEDEETSDAQSIEERLTKEEWQAINNLLSYQPDEDLTFRSGKDMQNTTHYLIIVSVGRAAAKIVNISHTEIVCGRFEQLLVSTKLKHRSTHCDLTLKYYGVSAPEGPLAQSGYDEQNLNALDASFVYSPLGENVDWRLSATISPCHATVFMESYDRLFEFLKRSKAISPVVALETATALQNKIEKVTRRAQEQIQMVLEEQSRFALDIDLHAPKVRIPIRTGASSTYDSQFLLDFGHFTLHTKESDSVDGGQSLYSRFYISGRDIAANFTDCGFDSQSDMMASSSFDSQFSLSPDAVKFYSIIDRCGMSVIVDQIKVPHPNHPSTRISVQVPILGIHFSPVRYSRLMKLLNIISGTIQNGTQPVGGNFQAELAPWNPPDLSAEAQILVWKGIGYSVASWQPCFLVLSGFYLYVLESERSQSYFRCSSMAGKHIFEVPPTNVGGITSCIGVCARGVDCQKALESFSTLIIKFRDEEKVSWLRGLIRATYRASAPPSVDILGQHDDGTRPTNLKTADLVVNGTLIETKLSIYGKTGDEAPEKLKETSILEVLAGGGKVHVVRCEGDLTVKVKLHSLKIKDELQASSDLSRQYLACSVQKDDNSLASLSSVEPQGNETLSTEDDDIFKDALPDFLSFSDPVEALISEKETVVGKTNSADVFYEAEDVEDSHFVSLTFLTRNTSSPDYDGVDSQMIVTMSKLEFYFNRPTLVALIGFGLDLSAANCGPSVVDEEKNLNKESSENKLKIEEYGNTSVKGLLGYGKGRVVFYLNMNVDSVSVYLNKEDSSQLAMFVQESFVLDLKVHPSSISIEGTLGNLRLCDLTLGSEHYWSWLCDIRNQGAESLIQFKFHSYSAEDDDYEGYDYSLQCHLSAVRIVFLYRFVQEITAYFMGLATPNTEEVVKYVDKVGGFEWLIEKNEIDGGSALKLDLSLETPIIIVPRNSMSKDFIQLDLGNLKVGNKFSWHGHPENDPSAVHLDNLDAEIIGVNMAVGIDGCLGKPMIRDGQDIHIYARRSLRDVFRKVPTLALEVKVGLLHCVMSDKEYTIILDCVTKNLNESPNLPPSFRDNNASSKETIRLLADKVNSNSQSILSRTVTIMAVEVDYALLELCNGIHEESPLAHIILEGLWVSYRMTSLSEADLYVTIPRFSILDIRPDSKPEMRLMLGSCTDIPKQSSVGSLPFSIGFKRLDSKAPVSINIPNSTMFVMDYRWRLSSQLFVIRVQQPRVLVVLDFLIAVCEFLVPGLGAITGREELMDPRNDPISKKNGIVLLDPLYKQREDVVHLSANSRLIADAPAVDDYTYDGCGKTIRLVEEIKTKELHSNGFRPIIIIGRGKSLRFVNVEIENGFLLKKYTYLSNDSSYSVSNEDGVQISFRENSLSGDIKRSTDNMEELLFTSDTSDNIENDSSTIQSFSFEAQVVSPEFTFYDSSKSSLDDSTHGEKLLRAKLDFSFMYASKENDIWIRALFKDLVMEAGSGLIILGPVDISGGYTSVKDKTNISVISTDIYVHLSLSVISLVLNLQTQAAGAFQYGNADLLSPCTHFDRLWVSQKENGHLNSLTFWRPRAPSNYVVLGDCVTSRPIPPSYTVMAVSSTYGRVRKPLRFELIGLFSAIQGYEGLEGNFTTNNDCSIWRPIPPQGYTALGCVAQIGTQPPPTHIVHCVRSDLVTSTRYSECIFCTSENQSFSSGFSIWLLDNVAGSFYAHPSSSCPPINICRDLNHLVQINSSLSHFSLENPPSNLDFERDLENGQPNCQSAKSSGWDTVRSISKPSNCYVSTPNFERIWWDKGGDIRRPVSIWRPGPRPGYAILGDCIIEGLEPPALGIIFKADNPVISAKPVQFTQVAHIVRKGVDDAFFWYPIAPPGYASLGCIVSRTDEAPALESFCCPRMDLVSQANILEGPLSRSSSSRGSHCWSLWKVDNQAYTFLARSDLKRPSTRLAFTIGDSVKPKTRDNITAEMKLRCLSVTVLDSLCGTMTPLFDVTISNMKLATHGRLEALNAVLISSTSASTFNTQLESWEPLVEPFDGIFKFETYDAEAHPTSKFCKRARVAATTALNINLSTENLNLFLESVVSWRRQRELEQKAIQLNEGHHGHADDSNFSALDEEDLQTVTIENKLGWDIYLKKAEQDSNEVELLHHDDYASLWVPPPRYTDRLNVAETREARRYVAVQIIKAKALPIVDDGNSHNFFCALRLVVDSQETYQQKLFPQSARTRCVRPIVSKSNGVEGTACWNELFIFEVPRKGVAKLEVEVTNLAAKAGKGEVVGASSFSVGHGANPLKKVASVKMLNQASEVQNIAAYPLRRTVSSGSDDIHSHSSLVASTSYFERKSVANIQTEVEEGNDIGFWVGLSPKGSWESFRSFLPLSVITKTLNGDYVAADVIIKNGKKHAVLRGLVTVFNDSDVKLEVSICHGPMIHTHSLSAENVVDSLNPGSSCILPWKSALKGSDFCLLVRPCTNDAHPPFSWGDLVNIGHPWGKEQQSTEQGSLSRQSTMKHGMKMPASFKLGQLEKTDVFFCSSTPNGDHFWFSVSTDASALHTELNALVYDWKISINSPLKLENRLPCPARFIVWEKLKNGNNIERQRGLISSRGSVNIHSADIQNPIYVTLFIQGGWCLEKDPVLVLDLSSNDHVSSFWMVSQQKRRLRVSIERDVGGTIAAPKTVRFFVPYWISNDSSLPLAYQVVEIEPLEASDLNSLQRSKTGRFGSAATRSPSISADRNPFGSRKNLQVLEVIEDTSPTPSMLSPQDYVGRGGVMLFSSRNDNYLSPRVGITVSVRDSENYSPGISLLDLEKKQRVDVKAFNSDGSYYNLSAVLHMSSDRTKVVHFQQQTLFINRVGCSLCLQQCDTQSLQWIHSTDPPLQLRWQSLAKAEMLRLRMDGYSWSTPFSVGTEGVMCISLNNAPAKFPTQLRVEVRSGTKSSRYEVIFRPSSFSSPYRIENHSLFLPIRFQQVDGSSDSWQSLLPNSSASFSWEDLGRPRQLELLVDGDDRSKSLKYCIDEISDHQPVFVSEEPTRVLRINILREDKVNVIKISDWMPENDPEATLSRSTSFSSIPVSENENLQQSTLNSEFHVIFEIAELGLSIIDHTPEEILYLSLQSLLLSYSTGLGSGITRLKLRMRGFQVDNQLPLTPTPVLFRPQRVEDETNYILKFSMTQQSNGSLDLCVYPYIGFQGPENSAFLINIHEPIIWRIHGMIQQINLSRLSETESTAVSVDPIIEIGVFNFSEVRFKVSMAMSPSQRPVGVLGFWASLMTALGNTENMPIRINQRFQENIRTRQSVLMNNAIANIKKDILGQPLQLLSGVDILGNASSALGHMSKGVAALSMDKKFIRQRQESKGVEDFGDVIREGGGALAKGFFRGFTGILTKPLEGAKASGVEGFVQGVGKGIIGAAAQPVSGVLDLLSKTTEGANAMRIKIASAIASEDQLLRRRLPRVIGGDNLLRPYDFYKAQGQVILQLAESVSFFRQVDLFKVRGKFALSDAYEDHFLLPKAKYLLVTHRRILLLQQASSIIGHKKFNPARDPCSVLWDVLWDDLMTMELTHGKKDRPDSIPSRIILYLRGRSFDSKDQVRIIKCNRESNQAFEVYTSIEQAMNTYGPNQTMDMLRRKAAKPYSAVVDSPKAEALPKDTFYLMSHQRMPSPVSHSSTFGTGAN